MSYLFRRNGIFYFRFAIPAQLRKVYGSKTEIRKSLKTFDKTTAQTLALYIAVHLKGHMTRKKKAIVSNVNYFVRSASIILAGLVMRVFLVDFSLVGGGYGRHLLGKRIGRSP